MNFKEAFEKNFAAVTEYGAGPSALGGLVSRRLIKHKRSSINGESVECDLHETEARLGPFIKVQHRSEETGLFKPDSYELDITVLGVFCFGNKKDMWINAVGGPTIGALRAIPGFAPTAVVSRIVDCDLTARAGAKFNLSGFIRDLMGNSEAEGDPPLWPGDSAGSEDESTGD